MRERNSGIVPSSSIFPGVVPGKKWKVFLPRRIIWQKWQEVVGDAVSRQAWPWYFRDMDCLVVAVSDNIWMQQLTFQGMVILQGLNKFLPATSRLSDIKFSLGDVQAVRRNIPVKYRSAQPLKTRSGKGSPPPPEVSKSLDNLHDRELKELFQSVLKKAF